MTQTRKCIKFTGYIYMPDERDEWNSLREYAAKRMGRLIIFDEQNNNPDEKAFAFESLGQMLAKIENEYKKRTLKKVQRLK